MKSTMQGKRATGRIAAGGLARIVILCPSDSTRSSIAKRSSRYTRRLLWAHRATRQEDLRRTRPAGPNRQATRQTATNTANKRNSATSTHTQKHPHKHAPTRQPSGASSPMPRASRRAATCSAAAASIPPATVPTARGPSLQKANRRVKIMASYQKDRSNHPCPRCHEHQAAHPKCPLPSHATPTQGANRSAAARSH